TGGCAGVLCETGMRKKSPGLLRGPGFVYGSLDLQVRGIDRQLADALAGGGEDGTGDRGREGRQARLADTARRFRALHDVHLDLRHLIDAQHLIVVEVRLLDAPVLEGHLAVERGSQAVDDRALDLALDNLRVDGLPAIDRSNDAMHLRRAIG